MLHDCSRGKLSDKYPIQGCEPAPSKGFIQYHPGFGIYIGPESKLGLPMATPRYHTEELALFSQTAFSVKMSYVH